MFGGMLPGKQGRLEQSCEQLHDGIGVQGGTLWFSKKLAEGVRCLGLERVVEGRVYVLIL